MKIQLIQGKFSKNEALSIGAKMIEVKINFHEQKINTSDNEEDIKMRENRIKLLQNQLSEFRKFIECSPEPVSLISDIQLS